MFEKLDEVLFDLLHSTSAMDYGSDVNWFDVKANVDRDSDLPWKER